MTVHINNLEKYLPGYKDRILSWIKIYFRDSMTNEETNNNHFRNFFNDEHIETLCEIDRYRYISLICKEVELGRPVPLDKKRLVEMGWDTKKRPISLTLKMLQGIISTCNTEGSIPCTVDKEEEEDKEEDKEEEKEGKARPNSLDAVKEYFISQGSNALEGEKYFDHFTSNGWKVGGKTPMRDWRAAARNWMRNSKDFKPLEKARIFHCNICGEDYSSSLATHIETVHKHKDIKPLETAKNIQNLISPLIGKK